MRFVSTAIATGLITALCAAAAPAHAVSPAARSLTLPADTFELGLGVGLGHASPIDYTGLGLNLELGYGLTSMLELRVRTGLRFGQNGRSVHADRYARAVESETYKRTLGGETIANPEVGLRFGLVRGTVDLAVDARLFLPVSGNVGLLVGVPLSLALGNRLKFDTGLFVPMVFYDAGTWNLISIPLHLWIRLAGNTVVGPMTGFRFHDGGGESVPLGFGIATPLAYDADVRFWVLWEDITADREKEFGAGVGLYVNF